MFDHILGMVIEIWGFHHQYQSWSHEKVGENNVMSKFFWTGPLIEIIRAPCFFQLFLDFNLDFEVKAVKCQSTNVKGV